MQDALRVTEVFTNKYAGWRNCHCNCGNVLVAHVEIDLTDPSLTPGRPHDVEIDKTYAELTGADLSYVKLKAFEGETPVQTFFLPPVAETHAGYLGISYSYEESGYAYSVNVTEEGAKLIMVSPS